MKKIGLAAGSVVITLVLAEIVLRLTGLGLMRPQFQFDPHTGERLEAGTFVSDPDLFWREPEDPSSAGGRPGRFIRMGDPVPAKSRKLRILTLGDSCTRISAGGRPYSVVLEQMLDPVRVEVYNASLPGYTSHQGLAWLRKQLLAYQPDLVIIYFGWNDHWRSTGITDRDYAASLAPGRPRLLNLFARKASPPPVRVSEEDYAANLREMERLIGEAGGQSWVILAPYNINRENTAFYLENGNIVPEDDPQRLHESYLAVAREVAGGRAVDLASVFAGMEALPTLLMRDGIHPTDPGHAVIARVLADRVQQEAFRQPGPSPAPLVSGLAELARQMSAAGPPGDAAAAYRRAMEADPGFLKARLGLSWLLATSEDESLRDGPAARAVLDPARESQARSPDFLFIAAGAEAACGDFEAALALVDSALALLQEQNQAGSPFARRLQDARRRYAQGETF